MMGTDMPSCFGSVSKILSLSLCGHRQSSLELTTKYLSLTACSMVTSFATA